MIIKKTYAGSKTRAILPKEKDIGGVIGDANSTTLQFNLPKGYEVTETFNRQIEFDCYVDRDGVQIQPAYLLEDDDSFKIPPEIAASNEGKVVRFNLKFTKMDENGDTISIEKSEQSTLYFRNSANGELTDPDAPSDIISLLANRAVVDLSYETNMQTLETPLTFNVTRLHDLLSTSFSVPVPILENGKIPSIFIDSTYVITIFPITDVSELYELVEAHPPDLALLSEDGVPKELYLCIGDSTQEDGWYLVQTNNPIFDTIVAGELTIEDSITTPLISASILSTDEYGTLIPSEVTIQDIEDEIATKVDKTTEINGHALSSDITLTKDDIGLGNVDNTSDIDKPISTATRAALDTKVDTSTEVNGHALTSSITITKGDVGLGNVVNAVMDDVPTSNSTNYVKSGGVYSAIDTVQSDIDTHEADQSNPHNVNANQVGLGNVENLPMDQEPLQNSPNYISSGAVYTAISTVQNDIDAHEADTDNPHRVTQDQVGLGNVDNTSDADKPISTATQTALDGKADKTTTVNGHPLSSDVTVTKGDVGLGNVDNYGSVSAWQNTPDDEHIPTEKLVKDNLDAKVDKTTTVNGHALSSNVTVTKGDVGLGNVDNTSDADKPISTATQTALDAKLDDTQLITSTSGWSDPLSDSNIPSEKLTKATLDTKIDKLAQAPTADTYTKVTINSDGLVTAGSLLIASDIPTIEESQVNGLITDLGNKVNTSQIVASWSSTPLDTNIPSEALTKSSLDSKLDDTQLVTSTNGWSNPTLDTNIPSEKLVSEALATKVANTQIVTSTVSWSNPLTETNIPSEKLVKLSLDEKVDKVSGYSLMSDAEHTKLGTIAEGAEVNVQANWNETDTSSDAYIQNKPAINDATLTIQKNGTQVATFTANASTDVTANISVPTQASDINALPDDTTFATINGTSVKSSEAFSLQTPLTAGVDYQVPLVGSGTGQNIKTINSSSILGTGNIALQIPLTAGVDYQTPLTAGTDYVAHNTISGQVYATKTVDNVVTDVPISYSTTADGSYIVQRQSNGQITVPPAPLADTDAASKAFVNSSIGTSTANFLGRYDAVTDLGNTQSTVDTWVDPPTSTVETLVGGQISSALPSGTTPTNNDYVFVSVNKSATLDTDWFWRFKYSASSWLYEYTLNNSSFTQAQWDAINSGLSSADKTKLDTIAQGAEVNVQSNWNETDASSDAYILNKPTIPTVNDSTITIQKNGTTVDTFTLNQSSAKSINITVPTTASDVSALPSDTTFATINGTSVKGSTAFSLQTPLTAGTDYQTPLTAGTDYQVPLVGSGTGQNIKTINNSSILGSGNISLQTPLTAGTNITIEDGVISASGTFSTTWGNIAGSISNQTDLSNALADKLDDTQLVTSWSSTTSDTNIPSEKLTKDSLDAKIDDTQLITSWSGTPSDTNIPSEKLTKNTLDAKVTPKTGAGVTFTADHIATFDDTTGKVIKDSGYTIATSVPSGAVFTDTKNTAGATDSSSKLFLIGATAQSDNPQTYSQDTAYVGTDGCLYSGGTKVLTAHQDISGKVSGPSSSTDGDIALFDGTTGKIIKDSGMTIGASIPAPSSSVAGQALIVNNSGDGLTFGEAGKVDDVKIGTTSLVSNKIATIPKAGASTLGVVQTGYTTSGKDYAVVADSSGNLHVEVPWTDNNTDVNVTQTNSTANAKYPLLAKNGTGTGTITSTSLFSSDVTVNPSTATIEATTFKGALDGNASTATSATTASKLANTSAVGGTTQPVYFTANGVPEATTYALNKTVPADAVFTDTTYQAGAGLTLDTTTTPSTFKHSNSITASGTTYVGSSTVVPKIQYDAQGHLTAVDTANISFPVTSVNTKTGAVSLTYSDVGAANNSLTNVNAGSGNAGKYLRVDSTGGVIFDSAAQYTLVQATIETTDWSSNTATVTASGVTANNLILVASATSNAPTYNACGVKATAQSTNTLTFTCATTPSVALDVIIMIMENPSTNIPTAMDLNVVETEEITETE